MTTIETQNTEETLSRKSIARWLDMAAGRADMLGMRPASAKQCWFLAGLMESANDGFTAVDTQLVLSSRKASEWIDMYLADQEAN
jgi:hypothetical protein